MSILRCECVAMGKRSRRDAATNSASLRLSAAGLDAKHIEIAVDVLRRAKSRLHDGEIDAGFMGGHHAKNCLRKFFSPIRCSVPVTLSDGSTWDFGFANPTVLLSTVLEHNDSIFDMFRRIWEKYPSSQHAPWGVIYGFDECWTGSNPMHQSGRKCMILSYSFLEICKLDRKLLAKSSSWFTVCTVRSLQTKQVPGQWSALFKHIMKEHFLSEVGGLQRCGAIVMCRGLAVPLFGKVSNIVADGDGFRIALQCKGGQGTKICPVCDNVVKNPAYAARSRSLCSLSCTDPGRFAMHTPESILKSIRGIFRTMADHLDGRTTKLALNQLKQASGFDPCLHGVWADREIRKLINVTETITFDWMHCCLADGFVSHEIARYLSISDHTTESDFDAFCDLGWASPGARPGTLSKAFKSVKAMVHEGSVSGHTRPSCSDMLRFIAILNFWVRGHPDGPGKAPLLASLRVVGAVQAAKFHSMHRNNVDIDTKAQAITRNYKGYLIETIRENGGGSLVSKHHWFWHIPIQYVRDGGEIIDCFIVERLHRRVKKFSKRFTNTKQMETSLLELVTAGHCFDGDLHDSTYLAFPGGHRTAPTPEDMHHVAPLMATCASSQCVVDGDLRVRVGDFLRFGDSFGRVGTILGIAPDNDVRIVVDVCRVVNSQEMFWNIVEVQEVRTVLKPSDHELFQPALAWKELGAQFVVLLQT